MLLSYQFMLGHKPTPAYAAYAALRTCSVQPSDPTRAAPASPQSDPDRAELPSIPLQKTGFAMKTKLKPALFVH